MSTVEYAHIVFGSDNVPIVAGTQVKLIEIVLDHVSHGSDAHEIHREFPHLSLGQIHSALAYYYDHQQQMDEEIAQRIQRTEGFRQRIEAMTGPSLLKAKLRAQGLLS
jgi:uncharacterized protein (DUF433 family)